MNVLLKRRSLALLLSAALLAVPASIATAGDNGDTHEAGDHGTGSSEVGTGGPGVGDVGETHPAGVGGDGYDTGSATGTLPSEGGEDGGSCPAGANSDCVVVTPPAPLT